MTAAHVEAFLDGLRQAQIARDVPLHAPSYAK
jgi:hypothetical protein